MASVKVDRSDVKVTLTMNEKEAKLLRKFLSLASFSDEVVDLISAFNDGGIKFSDVEDMNVTVENGVIKVR